MNAIVGLEAVVEESVPPVVFQTKDVASEEPLVNSILSPAHRVVDDVVKLETGTVEGITYRCPSEYIATDCNPAPLSDFTEK